MPEAKRKGRTVLLDVERLQSLMLAEETEQLKDLNVMIRMLKQVQVLSSRNRQSKIIELQIEELNYEIKDVIESYIVLARSSSSSKSWRIDRILLNKFALRKIRSDIKNIRKKINHTDRTLSEQQNTNTSEQHNNDTNNIPSASGQQINIPIGRLEQQGSALCGLLISDEESSSASSHIGFRVIPICGVVGSGKTTLAKLVINDPKIVERFQTRKLITVSDEFEVRSIYEQIIDSVDKYKIPYIPDSQLFAQVDEICNSNKCLIVLDDILSTEAWETVCEMLPKLHRGSYVLVTTRVRKVAEYLSQNQRVHYIEPLNEDESLDLFTKVLNHQDASANLTLSKAPLDGDHIVRATNEATTSSTETHTRFEVHKCIASNVNLSSAMEIDDEANLTLSEPPLDGDHIVCATDEATTSSTETHTRFEVHNCIASTVNLSSAMELDDKVRKLIKDMVRFCDGSPRLIKNLALHLRPKRRESANEVRGNIQAYLSEFCCQVYNELPDYLQPCILFLSHFLEDEEIDPKKLYHLWMIEGLLPTGQSREERMMDMPELYLRELALKRMVEEVPAFTEKFKACRFVQGMENFCVRNSEQERFLKIIDLRQADCSLSSSDGPRRLVIYLGDKKVDISPEVAKRIRSLRVVLRNAEQQIQENELVYPTEMLNLKEFGVLRILDFDGIDFQSQKLPRHIFNRKLLSYLSFKGCVLEELPSSITKLSYLQVLDLRVEEGSVEIKIPQVLQKMKRLNHLYLPLKFATQNGEKLLLDRLTELETLVNFNTKLCRANDVLKLCKLRDLAAKVEENFDDFESITNYMKTSTSNNWPLHCSIDIRNLDCYAEERHSVLRDFLRCKVLRTLRFRGGIGSLPPYDELSPNLTMLVLHNSHLKEDPMPSLEKLASLGILILSDDAYVGKKMFCSASGFPQLKYLRLLNLYFLQRVEVENTAMPIFLGARIDNCPKLDNDNCNLISLDMPLDNNSEDALLLP